MAFGSVAFPEDYNTPVTHQVKVERRGLKGISLPNVTGEIYVGPLVNRFCRVIEWLIDGEQERVMSFWLSNVYMDGVMK